MAQSRLEKIGTIYTRVSGLLKAGAMKVEDKPIWYEVFAAFPPKLEPRYDRPAPNLPIRNIFYEEDVVRAKYHKSLKQHEMISLSDNRRTTQSQKFLNIYQHLKSQGALDDEQIFATAQDLLAEQRQNRLSEESKLEDEETSGQSRTVQNFAEAKTTKSTIDINNLFKE